MLNTVDFLKEKKTTLRKLITLYEVRYETSLEFLWRTKLSFMSWVWDFSTAESRYSVEGSEREWDFTNHGNKDCGLQGYPTEWPLNRPQQLSVGGLGEKNRIEKEGRRERERWVEQLCSYLLWPPVLHCQQAGIHGGWRRREWLYE